MADYNYICSRKQLVMEHKVIIGRRKESALLKKLVEKNRSEFVAVYGRRRVGKTFLIREYFGNQFAFHLSGLANASTEKQLLNFELTLERYTDKPLKINNWIEAFHHFIRYLESIDNTEKKVIFLDELPWFDTKGSDFISGLEYFWNSWASARKDILLITCGSAASWMLNKLINNTGGLHNRITQRMKIEPFTLAETEEMLQHQGCKFNRFQIAQLYMVLGGIPFYLNAVEKGKSAEQNIQSLFFDKNGLLREEFKNLFRSLFRKHEIHETIVETLAKKSAGFTRKEIVEKSKIKSGGTLTKVLDELEESGFIASYQGLGYKKKDICYRLSDFYCYFYFRFLTKPNAPINAQWIDFFDSPAYRAWSGFAFEQLCLDHIHAIKNKLSIAGIQTSQTTWSGEHDGDRVQIDFLIDRRDQVINLCECKFSISEFVIDKKYATELAKKIEVFRSASRTKKATFLTIISSNGVKKNEHYNSLVQNEITLNDLFVKKND